MYIWLLGVGKRSLKSRGPSAWIYMHMVIGWEKGHQKSRPKCMDIYVHMVIGWEKGHQKSRPKCMDIYVHMVTGWEKGYQKLKPKCMVRFYRQSQVLDPSHLPWGHTHTFIKFSCLPSYKPHPDLTNATSHSTVCKHVLNYPRPY